MTEHPKLPREDRAFIRLLGRLLSDANLMDPAAALSAPEQAVFQHGLSGIGADTLRATFKSFDTGGFSLNFPTHPGGNYQAASLCLKISDAWVGSFTKTTTAAV